MVSCRTAQPNAGLQGETQLPSDVKFAVEFSRIEELSLPLYMTFTVRPGTNLFNFTSIANNRDGARFMAEGIITAKVRYMMSTLGRDGPFREPDFHNKVHRAVEDWFAGYGLNVCEFRLEEVELQKFVEQRRTVEQGLKDVDEMVNTIGKLKELYLFGGPDRLKNECPANEKTKTINVLSPKINIWCLGWRSKVLLSKVPIAFKL